MTFDAKDAQDRIVRIKRDLNDVTFYLTSRPYSQETSALVGRVVTGLAQVDEIADVLAEVVDAVYSLQIADGARRDGMGE